MINWLPLIGCLPLLALLCWGGWHLVRRLIPTPFAGALALDLARSLREAPGTWSDPDNYGDRTFYLQHTSGIQIWVANSAYGLHVDYHQHRLWGSVNVPASPDQTVVWREARKLLKATPPQNVEHVLRAALAKPIQKTPVTTLRPVS